MWRYADRFPESAAEFGRSKKQMWIGRENLRNAAQFSQIDYRVISFGDNAAEDEFNRRFVRKEMPDEIEEFSIQTTISCWFARPDKFRPRPVAEARRSSNRAA